MAFEKLEQEKQLTILNAACEVFAKHGYQKASMKDISDAAGVSKSVLFKYFSTKENLYLRLFRLASDSILEADAIARAESAATDDLFLRMRRSAKSRLSLFQKYPWVYRFSYTAAFDPDPFVKQLVQQELERYPPPQDTARGTEEASLYSGLREDIPPAAIRQMVSWISQGYLENMLHQEKTTPDALEQGFEEWLDILEVLFRKERQPLPKHTEGQVK